MTNDDEARLQWLKSNPTKTYADLPQGLWDADRIALEVARQNASPDFGIFGGSGVADQDRNRRTE